MSETYRSVEKSWARSMEVTFSFLLKPGEMHRKKTSSAGPRWAKQNEN